MLEEVVEQEEVNGEVETVEGGEGVDTIESATAEPDHIVVTIGDKEPKVDEEEEKLTKVPKFIELRDAHRAKVKEAAELRRKLEAVEGKKVEAELGVKPTLESSDYDNAKFESELEAWIGRKAALDAVNRAKAEANAKAEAVMQAKVEGYTRAKTEFAVRAPDFADAEIAVDQAFNATQRGIMLKCAKDVPLTVYALGKDDARLKELAAISDPVDFTWRLSQVEAQMKVSSKPAQFKAETRVGGVRAVGGGADAQLARLREEAERTNDYTKVNAYKREMAERKSA